MLTVAIYTTSLLLLAGGFSRAGVRPVLFVLAGAMAASGVANAELHGPDRVVAFILIDLATVFAVKIWHDRPRDRLVAAVAGINILWSVAYVLGSYINYPTYAALLNCGALLQLLIGGGFVDDLGRRIADRLDSLNPWLGHYIRDVAIYRTEAH